MGLFLFKKLAELMGLVPFTNKIKDFVYSQNRL